LFDSDQPNAYEKVYQGLAPKLAKADFAGPAQDLGLARREDGLVIPLFGRDFVVGREGAAPLDHGPAEVADRIVLAYYAMHGGRGEPAESFRPYRELPGGADFSRSLSVMINDPMARRFAHRLPNLEAAARKLGGSQAGYELSADFHYQFIALPKIPLRLVFNDADEDFPAEARVFFDITAPNFLDMECLAVLPVILVRLLAAAAPGS